MSPKWQITARIGLIHRVIITIGKHIVAYKSLSSGRKGVCIDESADAGIVVTALQVVEPGFSVVVVAVPFVEVIISHFKSLRKMENEPNFTK